MRKEHLVAGIAVLLLPTLLLPTPLLSTMPASAGAGGGEAPAAAATVGPDQARPCEAPPVPASDPPLLVDPDQLAAPAGAGRPADAGETATVRAGIDNFLACLNSGDHHKASALFTPRFVRDYMGQQDYEEVPNILGGIRIDDMRVGEVTVYEDGSFGTESHYVAYGHALVHERQNWWLDDDGFLKLNWAESLPSEIPRRAVRVSVDMGEYFFRLSRTRICAPAGSIVFDIRNVGQEQHEAILLHLPPWAVPADIFNGRLTPEQVKTIGQGGANAALSLVRVRPGTYWLVDFIPAPDGVPHAQHGQVARITVERQSSTCR